MVFFAKNMSKLVFLGCLLRLPQANGISEGLSSSVRVHPYSQKRPGLKIETGPILMGFTSRLNQLLR